MFTMMVIMALVTTALAGPLLPHSSVLMASSTVDVQMAKAEESAGKQTTI